MTPNFSTRKVLQDSWLGFFSGVVDPIPRKWFPLDDKAFTTLLYANGPSGIIPGKNRHDPTKVDTSWFTNPIISLLRKMILSALRSFLTVNQAPVS